MEENRLYDILHAQVIKQGKQEEIMAIANIANRCLNPVGKKRPAMKEVAGDLLGMSFLLQQVLILRILINGSISRRPTTIN
ncbi:hypothetical protein ACOSP7_004136 [Xanthoceras sorbifolium]